MKKRGRTATARHGPRGVAMLGCKVTAGMQPGGFSSAFYNGKTRARKCRELGYDSQTIKEAASAFLEKRGLTQGPSAFDWTAHKQKSP